MVFSELIIGLVLSCYVPSVHQILVGKVKTGTIRQEHILQYDIFVDIEIDKDVHKNINLKYCKKVKQ